MNRIRTLAYLSLALVPAFALGNALSSDRHAWVPEHAYIESASPRLYKEDWSALAVPAGPAGGEVVAFIKAHEGYSATPYRCAGGYWTIGYGHRMRQGERWAHLGRWEAEAVLAGDVASVEAGIAPMLHVRLPGRVHTAVVSFAYNVGLNAFKNSQVLARINANDGKGAVRELAKWQYAHGRVVAGLKVRRQHEIALFYAVR